MLNKILGPEGVPLPSSTAEQRRGVDFEIGMDFNLQTGRSTVNLHIPGTEEWHARIEAELQKVSRRLFSDDVQGAFDGIRAALPPEGGFAYVMLPQEARILGMRLIVQATEAISTAAAMRLLLEVVQMHPNDASQALAAILAGTKADHQMAYEMALKRADESQQMQQPTREEDGTVKPS